MRPTAWTVNRDPLFFGVQRNLLLAVAIVALTACNRGPRLATPAPGEQPLAAYAAQRLVVTPVGRVSVDSLGWVQQLGGAVAAARRLDTAIATALGDRGLAQRWILPAELWRSYERNRSYATDPYHLAIEQLRAPAFVALSRVAEPLSTQLRTMIALHEDARLVLVPVELRFTRSATAGHGVLRVALLDPRFAEARWVGEVTGDTTSVPARALAAVAARLADLFMAP